MKYKKEKIWGLERNVFFTGLTSFFTDTSTKMVYSVMPLFLLSIGASTTTISLIEGITERTASLLKTFSGYWSDMIAGLLYDNVSSTAPFCFGSLMALIATVLMVVFAITNKKSIKLRN